MMSLYARDVGSEFDVQMLQTRRHIPRSHRDIAGHIFRTGVAAHAVVRVEISTQALIAADARTDGSDEGACLPVPTGECKSDWLF